MTQKIVDKRQCSIQFFKAHEVDAVGQGFAALAQGDAFLTSVGAIEECHVRIKAPAGNAFNVYLNRKLSFHQAPGNLSQ